MLSVYSDERFMKEALKEAEKAFEEGEIPVGAVVVCRNRIIARAYNQTEKLNDVTAHAEMIALTSAANYIGGKYLHDCKLYVTLEPCVMCAGALYWSQIDELIFGATDPKRGYKRIDEQLIHPKTTYKSGVCEEECADLLNTFFRRLRN